MIWMIWKSSAARIKFVDSLFFGSVLHDDFGPESDIDVLIEFKTGRTPGYLGLSRMERELGEIFLGKKLDLRTLAELSRNFVIK